MCCDSYNVSQFLWQETTILKVLGFELGYVTPETFLKRLVRMNLDVFATIESRALARFIMESTLTASAFVSVRASILAQSALLLAYQITHDHIGWKVDQEIEAYRTALLQAIVDAPPPVVSKYSVSDFCFASTRARDWIRDVKYVCRPYLHIYPFILRLCIL